MRLINTRTREVEEFQDNSLPRYAILSHTWGDEEMSLDDMQNKKRPKNKLGYTKIEFACEEARKEDLSHVWVDTCCMLKLYTIIIEVYLSGLPVLLLSHGLILMVTNLGIDKRSSAELQEAINSMFRYYSDAVMCYVYLADIPYECATLQDNDPAEASTRKWNLAFANSRWFTRGWTLQELIAPKQAKFFARGWKYIGLKSCLIKTISGITGIAAPILTRSAGLSSVSVAQRMSWASSRQTTRIEDRAYSLLGIFNVNIPMLYGEGSKAFIRLQEEIMKTSSDYSILAWEIDEDRETDGHLLAASPSDFASCRKVVKYGKPQAFVMTNRGLQISLRLVNRNPTANRPEILAILNCRYDDDFSGTLALRLQKYDSSDDYHAIRRKGSRTTYAQTRTDTRLKFISILDAESAQEAVPLLITREIEYEELKPKFWVESSNERFWITQVFPEQQWDQRKRLMHAGNDKRVRGGAVIETLAGYKYIIVFGFDARYLNDYENLLFGIWGMPYDLERQVTLQQVVDRSYECCRHLVDPPCFPSGCPSMFSSLTIYDSPQEGYLDVRMRRAEIMEDIVFVVTIALTELAELEAPKTYQQEGTMPIRNAESEKIYEPPVRTAPSFPIVVDVGQVHTINGKLPNTNSVRAYQKQLLFYYGSGDFQRMLGSTVVEAAVDIWMWLPPSLHVRYVYPPKARKILPHLLFCSFKQEEKYMNTPGLVAFSTQAGDEVLLFFWWDASFEMSVFHMVSENAPEQDRRMGRVQIAKSGKPIPGWGIWDYYHLSTSGVLPNDNSILSVSLQERRKFLNPIVVCDIQTNESGTETANLQVPGLTEEDDNTMWFWESSAFKSYEQEQARLRILSMRADEMTMYHPND